MKVPWLSAVLISSAVAFAAGSMNNEVPGFSIRPLSDRGGEEWWMPSTEPLELSRYMLTNETITRPITVTIMHYASSQQARKAFEMSERGRPAAPRAVKSFYWEAAHEWLKLPFEQVDMFLLKGNDVVGVSDLPLDFSKKETDRLLHALADGIAKTESGGAAKRSQPVQPSTNSTPVSAGSGR
jgi:hypothetical protein